MVNPMTISFARRAGKKGENMRAVCVLLSAVIASPLAAQDQSREPGGAGLVLEEIIVTATRRERSLMEVPLAVSAYGAEQLELSGVTDIGQLMRIAPSLHLSVGQGETVGATARIRGIGTTADTPGFESAVGLYVDGVYRNRAGVGVQRAGLGRTGRNPAWSAGHIVRPQYIGGRG